MGNARTAGCAQAWKEHATELEGAPTLSQALQHLGSIRRSHAHAKVRKCIVMMLHTYWRPDATESADVWALARVLKQQATLLCRLYTCACRSTQRHHNDVWIVLVSQMALDYVVRTVKHDAALKRCSRTRTRTTRACLSRISCTRLNFPRLAFVFRCVGVSLQPAESPVFFASSSSLFPHHLTYREV